MSASVLFLELREQLRFLFAQRPRRQQIGPPEPGTPQRLLQPPAPDVLVVPREQLLGHSRALVHLGPRVLRALEKALRERLLERRLFIAQRPRQLAHHRIDQRHRRELAAREHEVAERQLLVDAPRQEPLIDAFVAAAKQRQRALLRQLHRLAVIEPTALRRQVNGFSICPVLPGCLERPVQRLGQHHHAGPAAVRTVVHRPVVVAREIARIPRREAPQSGLQRAAGDAAPRRRTETADPFSARACSRVSIPASLPTTAAPCSLASLTRYASAPIHHSFAAASASPAPRSGESFTHPRTP